MFCLTPNRSAECLLRLLVTAAFFGNQRSLRVTHSKCSHYGFSPNIYWFVSILRFIWRQAHQPSVSHSWWWRQLFENQTSIRVIDLQHIYYGLSVIFMIFMIEIPYTSSKVWTRFVIWYHLRQLDHWSQKPGHKKAHKAWSCVCLNKHIRQR